MPEISGYLIILILLTLVGYQSFRTFRYGEKEVWGICYLLASCVIAAALIGDLALAWSCGAIGLIVIAFEFMNKLGITS